MEQQINILLQTIEGLNATIATLSENQRIEAENHKKEVEGLNERIKELTAQVAYLNRQLYGRKAEKLPHYDPNQLELFTDEFATEQAQAKEKRDEAVEEIERETPAERRQKRQNRKMMKDLPVLKRTVIDVEGIDLTLYRKIGEEVTRVFRHRRNALPHKGYPRAPREDAAT